MLFGKIFCEFFYSLVQILINHDMSNVSKFLTAAAVSTLWTGYNVTHQIFGTASKVYTVIAKHKTWKHKTEVF